MCCDTMCGAQKRMMSDRLLCASRPAAVRQLDVASRATKAAWCGVEASMTSPRLAIRQQ